MHTPIPRRTFLGVTAGAIAGLGFARVSDPIEMERRRIRRIIKSGPWIAIDYITTPDLRMYGVREKLFAVDVAISKECDWTSLASVSGRANDRMFCGAKQGYVIVMGATQIARDAPMATVSLCYRERSWNELMDTRGCWHRFADLNGNLFYPEIDLEAALWPRRR